MNQWMQSPSRRLMVACGVYLVAVAIQQVTHLERYRAKAPEAAVAVQERLYVRVREIWPEPHAAFVAGTLYGLQAHFPAAMKQDFANTGLTHVLAVSGFNVSIIVSVCSWALGALRVRRKRAFYFVVLMVAGFVYLVGMSASAVRAGVMGVLALMSGALGRGGGSGTVLVVACTLMVMAEPRILLFDRGFHLSVLATIGVTYASPRCEEILRWITERWQLRGLVATTLGAYVLTFPYLLVVFGRVSFISIAANLIVVPVIPCIMASGAIALALGFVWVPMGIALGIVSWIASSYVLAVVTWSARIPYSSAEIAVHWSVAVLLYIFILVWLSRGNAPSRTSSSAVSALLS